MPPNKVLENEEQQHEASMLDAMEAGLNNPDAVQIALDEQPTQGQNEADDQPAADAATDETATQDQDEAQPQPPLTAKQVEDLTQARITAALEANNKHLYGKVGTMLQQATERVKSEVLQAVRVSNPEITKEQLAALKSRFVDAGIDEIGDIVADFVVDASKLRGGPAPAATPAAMPTPGLGPDEVQARIDARADELRQETAISVLTSLDPDWTKKRDSVAFKQWFVAQPQDYQDRINGSWNPGEVLGAIRAFEATQAPATPNAHPKKADKRLTAAIAPKTSGGSLQATISVEDAMELGFKNP